MYVCLRARPTLRKGLPLDSETPRTSDTLALHPDPSSSIGRRTVLIGSAWAVPAIALTTASPAFASSNTALAFSRSTYRGATCATITGVRITAMQGATAQAGISVTASLSGGYTFADGGTTSTGTTGSDGSMTLADIKVPASGGTATVSATSSGATTTSAFLRSVEPSAAVYVQNGTSSTSSDVPSGSTPVGGSLYVTPNADLIDAADGGKVLSADVAAWGEIAATSSAWSIPVRKADGSCVWVFNGTERATVDVPNGSTPSIGSSFITADGREMVGAQGTVRITDVKARGTYYNGGSTSLTAFSKQDGTFVYLEDNTVKSAVGVPSGSTPACGSFFLSPDGTLVDGVDGSVIASRIAAFGLLTSENASWLLTARETSGRPVILRPGSQMLATGVPWGSRPVGGGIYLARDGRLIDGVNAGRTVATGVGTPGAFAVMPDSWRIPLAAPTASAAVVTDGISQAVAGVPAGSSPVTGKLYLTPSGALVDSANGWSTLATSIAAIGQIAANRQDWAIPARKTDGSAVYIYNGQESNAVGVPAGSIPVAGSSFVTTDGRELRGSDGVVRMTGVAAYGDAYFDGTDYFQPFAKADGSFTFLKNSDETSTTGIPAGSTPVAARLYLAPDGRLIDGGSGSVIATQIATVGRIATRNGGWVLPVVRTDGAPTAVTPSGEVTVSAVPAGSTPVAAGLFHTTDRRLIDGLNGGAVLATNDVLVGMYRELYDSTWSLPLGMASAGC